MTMQGTDSSKKTNTETTVYLRHGQIAVAMDIELYNNVTTEDAAVNRYVLSGDLLAGRITTKYLNNSNRLIKPILK